MGWRGRRCGRVGLFRNLAFRLSFGFSRLLRFGGPLGFSRPFRFRLLPSFGGSNGFRALGFFRILVGFYHIYLTFAVVLNTTLNYALPV